MKNILIILLISIITLCSCSNGQAKYEYTFLTQNDSIIHHGTVDNIANPTIEIKVEQQIIDGNIINVYNVIIKDAWKYANVYSSYSPIIPLTLDRIKDEK